MEYHQQRYARILEATAFGQCRWLDLGAGRRLHGGWAEHKTERVTGIPRYIIGYDVVSKHLRKNPDLTYRICGIGEKLPFADQSIDLVTANMVLEHLSDPLTVFSEIGRVLAPGGHFIFVTPNRGHPIIAAMNVAFHPSWRQWLARRAERRLQEHIFRTFYRANTAPSLRRLADKSGLKVVELETFCSLPMTNRIPILRNLERLWIGLTETRLGAPFRSNIIGKLSNARLNELETATRAGVESAGKP